MDDILVFASNEAERDDQLRKVLQRLQGAGLTLNVKCEFGKKSIRFRDHVIDEQKLMNRSWKPSSADQHNRTEEVHRNGRSNG